MRFDGGKISRRECFRPWTSQRLSGAHLRNDVEQFIASDDPEKALKDIKGIPINQITGKAAVRKSLVDLARVDLAESFIRTYLLMNEPSFTWAKFDDACYKAQAEAFKKGLPILNKFLLPGIRRVYSESLWSNLSLDLVAAVLRQQSFSRKVIRLDDLKRDETLIATSYRYYMFMLLMKPDEKGVVRTNVPALDVDLFWHKHQLFPGFYHRWCETYLGRRVNHDDTIGEKASKEGFEATKKVWQKTYNHAYSMGKPMVIESTSQIVHQTEYMGQPMETSSPELRNGYSKIVRVKQVFWQIYVMLNRSIP